jgi:hypothetical protein
MTIYQSPYLTVFLKTGIVVISSRGLDTLLIPRFESRYMKDLLVYRCSVLLNLVNYNDKVINSNFKEIKVQLSAKEYFSSFNFDSTASTSRFRDNEYVYFKNYYYLLLHVCVNVCACLNNAI